MARVKGLPQALSLSALTVGTLEVTGAATFAATVTATGRITAAADILLTNNVVLTGVSAGSGQALGYPTLAVQYGSNADGAFLGSAFLFSANGNYPATTCLTSDAANVLAQRNGANAQEFRVYGTTTGPKYLSIGHDGTQAVINSFGAGNLYLEAGGVGWGVEIGSGVLFPTAAGTHDIGFVSNRVRRIFLGGNTPAASAPMIDCAQTWNDAGVTFTGAKIAVTNTLSAAGSRIFEVFAGAAGTTSVFSVDPSGNIRCPGALIGNDNIFAGQTAYIQWSGRSFMLSPADGVILFQDSATTSFGRLCFGGTTSSFPALKRSGTAIQVRVADDTGYGSLAAYDFQMFGNAIYDASANKVVGARGAAVADATGAGDIVAQFNTLLARLRATGGHGLIAD